MVKEENINSFDLDIEPSYSLSIAIEDFQKGVQLYQNKNLKAAYPLVRKALLKFQIEAQQNLVMEATYLLATILFQFGKYNSSIKYFKDLNYLAENLNYSKYSELSEFMIGFNHYKKKEFQQAYDIFESLLIGKINYINRIQFFTYKARTSSKLGFRDKAISYFEEALLISKDSDDFASLENQYAQLLYELGLEYHYKILDELKIIGFSKYNSLLQWSQLFNQSIENFIEAIQIWTKRSEIQKTISAYLIMGNIYGYLKDTKKQIENYKLALKNSEEINEFKQYIKIGRILSQVLLNKGKYDEIIKLLQEIISVLNQNGVNEIIAIGGFHYNLGFALSKLEHYKEAAFELITALNLYQQLKIPINEHKKAIELIIEIYQKSKENEKISFYLEQLNKIIQDLNDVSYQTGTSLGILNDFWIITESGLEVYSYSPDMEFDLTLFGGFVSALQNFSFEINKSRIDSFLSGNWRYLFYSEKSIPFYILGRAVLNEPKNRILKVMKLIFSKFNSKFGKKFVNFSGDVSPFKQFDDILNDIDFNLT